MRRRMWFWLGMGVHERVYIVGEVWRTNVMSVMVAGQEGERGEVCGVGREAETKSLEAAVTNPDETWRTHGQSSGGFWRKAR